MMFVAFRWFWPEIEALSSLLLGYAVYSATKFGHRGFLAGAVHELARHGVQLSVYYPGSLDTPGLAHENEQKPMVTARIESSCSEVP